MKIPDDRKPSYEVTINGVKNFFAPGTEVSGDVASALSGTETFPPAPPETDKPFNIPIPAPGSTVSANPTLAGTEDSLTGIEIDGTKYKVGGSSGGGVLVVHRSMVGTPPKLTLDKTWQEIFDAASTGAVLIVEVEEAEVQTVLVRNVLAGSDVYSCEDSSELVFSTDSADGYPAAT